MDERENGSFPIDFVIPWVDGSDPEWAREKDRFSGHEDSSVDNRDSRYRDWGLLKYWFRGVERFAPWVNHIFFVTCGHVPEWLNLSAPKLVHVKHSDYIPQEYLPTFSSHPIELNLHRIDGLSEHFVYFNDDLFLTRPVNPELYFRGGLPVYPNEIWPVEPIPADIGMANIYVNDTDVINANFDPKETLRDRKRWFSMQTYSKHAVLFNLIFTHYFPDWFIGFRCYHLAAPILKSTMETVWAIAPEILDETSRHRFRDSRDVNQYVFRYWQYASNRFVPVKPKAESIGMYFGLKEDNSLLCKAVREQQYPQICLNDTLFTATDSVLQHTQEEITEAFESILPQKSIYEK